jgi:hypothetical protein
MVQQAHGEQVLQREHLSADPQHQKQLLITPHVQSGSACSWHVESGGTVI